MPDIMTPYYKVNKISSLFFVVYTVFTQFFFLRLILAASFTNYKRDYEERHRRRLAFKSVAILKAFALLSNSSDAAEGVRHIVQQPRGRKVSTRTFIGLAKCKCSLSHRNPTPSQYRDLGALAV